MCGPKKFRFFKPSWPEIGDQYRAILVSDKVWVLVLNWVCFIEAIFFLNIIYETITKSYLQYLQT